MDLKKSYRADLEHLRGQAFLLGLVFVLALFVVALEYTSRSGDDSEDSEQIDDMAQDIEMMPTVQHNDMIAAAPAARSQALSAKLNVVDGQQSVAGEVRTISETGGTADSEGSGGGGTGTAVEDGGASASSAVSPVAVDENDNPLGFQVVERLPEFPGGMVEFMKWLTKNLRYPVLARQQKIQGKVIVAFIINRDGTVSDIKVTRTLSPELDREALRVLRMMPKWKPGEENGKPCRTYFSIPVNFKL